MLKAIKVTKPKKFKKKPLIDRSVIEVSDDEHSTTFTLFLSSSLCPFGKDVDIDMAETEDNLSLVYTKKKMEKDNILNLPP
jgi:hypothetical protein